MNHLGCCISASGLFLTPTTPTRARCVTTAPHYSYNLLKMRPVFSCSVPLQALQSEAERERQAAAARAVALLEAKAAKLCEMLSSVLEDTKGRIEKKQAQTYEELLAEQQEAEEVRGRAADLQGALWRSLGCLRPVTEAL